MTTSSTLFPVGIRYLHERGWRDVYALLYTVERDAKWPLRSIRTLDDLAAYIVEVPQNAQTGYRRLEVQNLYYSGSIDTVELGAYGGPLTWQNVTIAASGAILYGAPSLDPYDPYATPIARVDFNGSYETVSGRFTVESSRNGWFTFPGDLPEPEVTEREFRAAAERLLSLHRSLAELVDG